MTTKPEPSEAEQQDQNNPGAIGAEELIAELREMLGESAQDLAQARVVIRKQHATIAQLQNELVKKAGDAGGSS